MDEILKNIEEEMKIEGRSGSMDKWGIMLGMEKIKQLILADQAKRNCKNCIGYGKCSIHDNFNIDYCSDFEEKNKMNTMRDSTPEEDKSVGNYIKSISKQTGLDFNDILDDIVSGVNK